MKRFTSILTAGLILTGATYAVAELADGYKFVEPASEDNPLTEVISGYEFRNASTQETQDDDFENPGMLMLDQGLDQWSVVEGSAGKSCADCHGDDPLETMKGVGSSFPKYTEEGDHRAFPEH